MTTNLMNDKRESLPEGWLETSLADACSLVTDGTHFSPPNGPDGDFMYVTAKNIRRWGLDLRNITYISAKIHNEIYARCPVEQGDVLYIKDGVTTGLAAINHISEPFSLLSSVALLKPKADVLESRFLKYWLNSPETFQKMTGDMTGSAIKRLVLKQIRGVQLPLPPLPEQIRIADKLDALLSRVEAGRERLERVPRLLKRFRQSVLSAAVSGELTREWRGGEDVEWEEIEFGQLIQEGPKNGLYKHSSAYGDGNRILRIGDFYDGELNPQSSYKRLSLSCQELEEFEILPGDIVVNRVNSFEYLGKSALIRNLEERTVFESNMMRIRIDRRRAVPSFCVLFLVSQPGRDELRRNAKHAVNQASINQGDVKGSLLTLPSLPEQSEIVRRVEALFAIADRIEARYTLALTTFNRLTPALLAKAFRGELVPQDPNDEPASVLLERIRTARVAAGEKPKRGRVTGKGSAKTAAGSDNASADGAQSKRRGRPPKAKIEADSIPQASNYEDAVQRLEAQKAAASKLDGVARARGTRQPGLFESAEAEVNT